MTKNILNKKLNKENLTKNLATFKDKIGLTLCELTGKFNI